MDTKLKARNELIAITFSHSVEMHGPYFMYVVRMPNNGYPKYYYKVFNGVSERDAKNQEFIDDIARYGDKYSYIKDSVEFIDRNIKDREAKEEEIEEEEDEYWSWKQRKRIIAQIRAMSSLVANYSSTP